MVNRDPHPQNTSDMGMEVPGISLLHRKLIPGSYVGSLSPCDKLVAYCSLLVTHLDVAYQLDIHVVQRSYVAQLDDPVPTEIVVHLGSILRGDLQ